MLHRNTGSRGPLFGVLLLVLLVLTASIYSHGLSAGLQFDDRSNLNGLEAINRGESLWAYVFGGNAGPLGRPLSLLTFALQSHSWPNNPNDFLYGNIALHLLNGCLVVWLTWLLVPGPNHSRSIYPPLFAGAVWLTMPLLVSSNLMIVQRMATLAGAIVFIGAISYVGVRKRFSSEPKRLVVLLSLVMVSATIAAAFAKENGLLFPVFCLALEVMLTHVAPVTGSKKTWRIWKIIFLLLPLAVCIVYLIFRTKYTSADVNLRGFDGVDRLLYQCQLLFQYLFRAILPRPGALGPFHDQLHITPNAAFYALSTLAAISWIYLIITAYRLRDKAPEFLFSLTWYLGGHLLESTTVPVELYFEHRNYVPIVGPVLGCVFLAMKHWNPARARIYFGVSIVYLSISLLGLYSQTTLWGGRLIAANVWVQYNPKSVRALVHLANVMRENGEYSQVPRMFENYIEENYDPRIKFMRLLALCTLGAEISNADKDVNYQIIENNTAFALGMSSSFEKLYAIHQEKRCKGLSEGDIYLLGAQLLKVPQVAASHIAVHNINSILTVLSIAAGDFESAKKNVYSALGASFYLDSFDVALKIANHTKDEIMKRDLWSRVYRHRPMHPVQRLLWDQWLEKIKGIHHDDLK